ncbi:hypothetical protein EAI_01098 [Harpegnathos saltator]|uniref:Uncharacterized protein n=1 Tax=Harpegnathos saltator TaxID=610380 RepID=E2B4V6_HARSA|nr:hypothetical protein EAI_01098 [Harpegnathos saltator]
MSQMSQECGTINTWDSPSNDEGKMETAPLGRKKRAGTETSGRRDSDEDPALKRTEKVRRMTSEDEGPPTTVDGESVEGALEDINYLRTLRIDPSKRAARGYEKLLEALNEGFRNSILDIEDAITDYKRLVEEGGPDGQLGALEVQVRGLKSEIARIGRLLERWALSRLNVDRFQAAVLVAIWHIEPVEIHNGYPLTLAEVRGLYRTFINQNPCEMPISRTDEKGVRGTTPVFPPQPPDSRALRESLAIFAPHPVPQRESMLAREHSTEQNQIIMDIARNSTDKSWTLA